MWHLLLADGREKLQDWRQQHNENLVMSSDCQHGRATVANVELFKVEERPDGQLLFNVRVTATAGKMELPIAIKDQGSVASNETTVLQSALGFAKELESSIRLRLGVEQQGL